MRHIIIVTGLLVLIFSSTLLLDWQNGSPAVQAQIDPNAPTAPNALYLPLIAGKATSKNKSGIHLGNRGSSDWQTAFLQQIQPPPTGAADGQWPAAVVIQSDQIYTLQRFTTDKCRIEKAIVKLTGAGEVYNVYKYLTQAIKAGTKVVIRITPSPGNFQDEAGPNTIKHTLRSDETPAGGDYCGDTQKKVSQYRDIRDLAEEMNAIYQVNTEHHWYTDSFYFEPANEPNNEWYLYRKPLTKTLEPYMDHKQAWIDMDEYFAALYDKAISLNKDLQILSPSMSQQNFGEHYHLGTCEKIAVGGGNGRSGLDLMKKTFGYDIGTDQFSTPKADGFAWHNYWRKGREMWLPPFGLPQSPPTVDDYCAVNDQYKPQSDHLFQYLSGGMQQSMTTLPTFITEADLSSPCQLGEAGAATSKDAAPGETRDSLLKFIAQEGLKGYGAQYVIGWLLVNQYDDESNTCRAGSEPDGKYHDNYEINWHEAYGEDGQPRAWFTLWWKETP